jgi:hypothetical protein
VAGYEGPVRQKSKDILYAGKKETLPSYNYKYPDGAREVIEEYGGYYGVYWSANEGVDHAVSIELFAEHVLADLREGLCDVAVIGHDNYTELTTETNHLIAFLKQNVTEETVRWKIDCQEGSFYWENTPRLGPIGGILTYDGAPHAPLLAWRNATAAELIRDRGGYLREHVPAEDPQVLEELHGN